MRFDYFEHLSVIDFRHLELRQVISNWTFGSETGVLDWNLTKDKTFYTLNDV